MKSRDQANKELIASVSANDDAKAQAALEAGADPNYHDYYSDAPLKIAADKGLHKIVKVLLDGGANAEGVSRGGYITNPLYFAIIGGHTEVVRVMLASDFYRVDVNAFFYHSETPLKCAAAHGNLEMVNLLLQRGAKPDYGYSTSNGISALSYVAGDDQLEIASALIKAGANVNAKEVCRNTPLHAAAERGKLELVRFLVENGADIGAVNDFNQTPASVAAGKGHQDVVKFLKSAHDKQANAKLQTKVSSNSLFSSSQVSAVTLSVSSNEKLLEIIKSNPEDVLTALKSIDENLINKLVNQIEARHTNLI